MVEATVAPGPAPGPEGDERADLARRLAHAQAAKRVGTVLCNKWRIEKLVGIGGMAQVFLATHRNGRSVAVKMMRPELAVEPLFVERFLREGYVANKVDHPGAVAILDDDVAPDGAPFLVMELLRGKTLSDRLRDAGPLPVGDALRITDAVLDVLAAAHAKGIVHRDIKPDNLFETVGGDVKVLDFGIARLREGVASRGQTQSGVTMGTVGYMAPEQARGLADAIDARSDLWAVGATLYALVTGRAVHEAATPNEALLLAMTSGVAPMRSLAPGLPPPVADLLDKALAFDKNARFDDARAMQRAVQSARSSSTTPAGPRAVPWSGSPQTGSLRAVAATGPATPTPVLPAASEPPPPPVGTNAPRTGRTAAVVLALAVGLAAAVVGVSRVPRMRAGRDAPVPSPPSSVPAVETAVVPATVVLDPIPTADSATTAPSTPDETPPAPPTIPRPAGKPARPRPAPRPAAGPSASTAPPISIR